MTAETARLIASLELQDKNFTRGLKNAEKRLGKIDKKLSAVGGTINRNVARGIDTLITKGIDAGGAIIQAAVDQESAIVGIRKTVDSNVDAIVKDLQLLSTQNGMTFDELAGIAETAGAMGIDPTEITDFTKQVAILGTTTNVSIEDAATSLGQLKTVLGFTGDEYDNFAATLVDLGNKGNSTEAQILEITKRTGAAAKTIGIATDKTLAWASAAANLGLSEEIAGTALSKLFVGTQKIVARGGEDLTDIGKVAGMTGKQFKKAFDRDASGALFSFIKGLKGLSKEQRVLAIEDLFGKGDAMTKTLLGLSEALDDPTSGLTASLKNANTAWIEGSAAQKEADKRFATSDILFKNLNNSVNLAAATIGTELLPVLNDLAKEGVAWLMEPKTQKAIKAFAVDLGKGLRSAVNVLKGIDWSGLVGALGTVAGIGKEVVKAFLGLPAWAQAVLIGGVAVNKLTGGALGSVVTDIFKAKLGITAGTVFLSGKSIVGGGAPVPGGGKGGATGKIASVLGKLGTAAFTLGTVFIAGASLVALAETFQGFITGVAESQADLQEKVDATNKQNFSETIANLQATNKNLARMNGFEEIIASGFGGGQITQNFEDAAARIVAEQGLSRRDTVAALDALKASQLQADELMLDTPGLDAAILTLERRLAKMPTTKPTPRPLHPTAPTGVVAKPGDNLFRQINAFIAASRKPPQPNRVQEQELRDIKTATKTAAQHNRVQADELRNIKSATTTQTTTVGTAVGNVKSAVTTMDANQKAALVAQTAVNAAGNMLSVFQSASQVLAQGSTTSAVNTNAAATRGVAPPIVSTLYTVASQIVAGFAANRPVIQSTNVVNNYTRTQRTGATSGSRGGQWGDQIG